MKKSLFAVLAIAALLPAGSLAQHSSKAAESKHSNSTAGKTSTKAVTITGQISADGKTLISETDDIWALSNPGVMQGLEGQKVLVKCQVNTSSKGEIHVFWVKAVLQDAKYAANRGDSAFRR